MSCDKTPVLYPYVLSLPAMLQDILQCLESKGFEAYIIGGCVRDSLLGNTPNDWDIATNAKPQEVQTIFQNKKEFNFILHGLQYGTIGLYDTKHNVCYEITTFRSDGTYTDSRYPKKVRFVAHLAQDVLRRDFSINALAYNPREGVLDYVNGMEDLRYKRIVCIGEAQKRFREDSLRILRAMRFRATLGFEIQKTTKEAMRESQHLLCMLSKERVRLEFDKLLMGKYVKSIFEEFVDIFDTLFSGILGECVRIEDEVSLGEDMDTLEFCLYVRYARLLCAFKQKKQILESLCFSKKEKKDIVALLELWDIKPPSDAVRIRQLLCKFGVDSLNRAVNLWGVRYKDRDFSMLQKNVQEISKTSCYTLRHLKIDGHYLESLGIRGNLVGRILRRLLEEVMQEKVLNTKKELRTRVYAILQEKL